MKRSKYISTKLFHTAFGVIIALFVLTQAVVVDQQVQKEEDTKEQSDSKETDSQKVTESIAITTSSFQVSLDYQSYLLGQIFTKDPEENSQTDIKNVLFSTQKAIKVILRRIISPNAP